MKLRMSKALAAAGLVIPALAYADDAKPILTASAESDYAALDEVVVTATRRSESIQAVPMSVTAVTRDFDRIGICFLPGMLFEWYTMPSPARRRRSGPPLA